MYLIDYTFDLFTQLRTGSNLSPAIIVETHIKVRFPSSVAVVSKSRNLARRQIDKRSPKKVAGCKVAGVVGNFQSRRLQRKM